MEETLSSEFTERRKFEKTILQLHQRRISLTNEILIAMMDFNDDSLNSSMLGEDLGNTYSLTQLVQQEVQKSFNELNISDSLFNKDEIIKLIENCMQEKLPLYSADKENVKSDSPHDQQMEINVELNRPDNIVENFHMLKQRISLLEMRISALCQLIPKLRNFPVRKIKINSAAIEEEFKKCFQELKGAKLEEIPENTLVNGSCYDSYNDLYYELRQNSMNLLFYKKSEESILLNQRPVLNPFIKPTVGHHTSKKLDGQVEKIKKPKFLSVP